jgi:toxin ParE1/3/4
VKVEWLPLVRQDRDGQLEFVAEQDLWAAIRLGDAIEEAIENLSDHPRMGRIGRVKGTRELVIPGTPYIFAYQVERNNIVILRLLHGAQKWPKTT